MHALVLVLSLALAPPTTEDLVKLGEGLAGRGDGKKAVGHLDKALKDPALADPLRARAERAYGLALLQMKKPKDAAAHLKNATALAPSDEKAWILLGVAFDQAEDFPASLAAYQDGSKANPKSSTLKHELGMALLEAGKNAEAAQALVEGTQLAPQDPELAADASYALALVGKWKDAREHALRAAELAPENADAFYNLGVAEAGLDNEKGARQSLERAVNLDEMHVPALLQLGMLESRGGADKSAVARFTRVLQVEPDNARAQEGLGRSLARMGTDDAKAKNLLLAVVQADPKNVVAHALLGDIADRADQFDEAVSRYEKARKLLGEKSPDSAKLKKRIDEVKARQKAKKADVKKSDAKKSG
jgi:Flp pilus assembly protein TadD